MRFAILTPLRKESILLVNHLVSKGLSPDLLLFYRPHTGVRLQAVRWQNFKAFLKRSIFFFLDSERIRRVRNANLARAGRLIDEFAERCGLSSETLNGIDHIEVDDVNGIATVNAIRESDIDVLFIWGIPIVTDPVLKAVRMMVINAHSSVLPEYRGSRSEFWQFHNQEFDNCGITLHRVDKNVDTGDILMQVRARMSDLINPEVLHAWNVVRVIEALPLLLNDIRGGFLKPIDQSTLGSPKTKTYRIRDIGIENQKRVYLGK
jgi:folate-dependent phosphoribosylglycinamide formyltransferase PurN